VLARFPYYRNLTISSLAVMTFGAFLMTTLLFDSPLYIQEAATFIAAAGMGPLWTLTLVILQGLMSKDELATATTGFGLVRSLFGALGGTKLHLSEPRF
jgi:hypothetical protein